MTHGRHIGTITKTSVCAKSLEQEKTSMRDGKYIATIIDLFKKKQKQLHPISMIV